MNDGKYIMMKNYHLLGIPLILKFPWKRNSKQTGSSRYKAHALLRHLFSAYAFKSEQTRIEVLYVLSVYLCTCEACAKEPRELAVSTLTFHFHCVAENDIVYEGENLADFSYSDVGFFCGSLMFFFSLWSVFVFL